MSNQKTPMAESHGFTELNYTEVLSDAIDKFLVKAITPEIISKAIETAVIKSLNIDGWTEYGLRLRVYEAIKEGVAQGTARSFKSKESENYVKTQFPVSL